MGFLKSLVVLLFAGCYAPDLQDCAVTCSTDAECGTGQVCGERGLCARSGASCEAAGDATATAADATTDDADPPPSGTLRIKIGDQGRVDVSGIGACDSAIAMQCDFVVELGVQRTLVASPHNNRVFEMWMKACMPFGNNVTCVLTPTAALTEAEAKFKHD